MKKNLIWLAAWLFLTAFSLPPIALADGPTPDCNTNPNSCQPPVPQFGVPHVPGNVR